MSRFFTYLLATVLFFVLIINQKPAAAQTADWRFGVIESYESPADATTLGVGWTRVRFQWAEVQADGPGTWTPIVTDEQINGEISQGRMVVGLLIGVPGWARDEHNLPTGLWLPHDDPGNSWANFVREVVGRYNGRINHWIIWNEPDITDPTAPGHTWDGSVAEFAQLQRVAYLTAKEVNASAVIHLPAFTHFWDPTYFGRFLTELGDDAAVEHDYYFDVATANLYFQSDTIYNIIQTFYATMAGHGIAKPVWLVETNAPPLDDPNWPVPNWTLSVTQAEQAAFVPQALAAALAAGADRIALYKLQDTPDDRAANPEPFGLVRQDGSRRPAFSTYRIAIRYLAGVTAASRERWDGVGQIRLAQADSTTTVLFARLPQAQQAQVTAVTETAVLVDMWGERQTVSAVDGYYTIDLPPALCTQSIGDYCMIGGTTYYLVQAAVGDLPPAVPIETETAVTAAVLTATASATITSTPLPPATATPTAVPTYTASATHTTKPSPSATPVLVTATPLPSRVPAPTPPAAASGLSYWLIGVGLLIGVALFGWRWHDGR